MSSIENEALLAKRGALVASQQQLVGQINRVGGAIAVIDELLSEQQAAAPAPSIIPEMLPVTKFVPCGQCVEPLGCDLSPRAPAGYVAPEGDAA